MPILATCHCGKRYQAEDRLAGQKMKCVACGALFQVPAENSPVLSTPSSQQEPSAEEDPLPILCRCGKKFHASHALLGKSVACTQCGASILVSFENAAPMIVQCECGEQTEVAAGMRGKRAQCNVCGRVLVMEGVLKADLEPAADAAPTAKQIDPHAAGAIHAQCECGKTMSVAKTFAGRRVRCPRCNREFRLPEESTGPPPAAPSPAKPRISAQVDDLEIVPLADRSYDDAPPLAPLAQAVAVDSPFSSTSFSPSRPSQKMSFGATKRKRNSEPKRKWSCLTIGITLVLALGGVVALSCGGLVFWATRPPTVSASAREPFDLTSIPSPTFSERSGGFVVEPGIVRYEIRVGQTGAGPGGAANIWLYLPEGEHASGSLPCVLIAPAGTNLLSGMRLGDGDTPEHLPYVRAGFAVVSFDIDGDPGEASSASENTAMRESYDRFRAARAGLANARNAFEYIITKAPEVAPARIYVAGHSSAGTLSLLFAAHEPRLAGCIAYAPVSDIMERYTPFGVKSMSSFLPEIADFVVQSSPITHADRFRSPVFLFHAKDDSNVPIEQSRTFNERLREAGVQVTFEVVDFGDHYESMINQGIPTAIQWMQSRK